VAGFLEAQGEFTRSVDVMSRLLAEYPPEPYAAAAQYALAQRVYAYAPQAAGDAKLREAKITRVDLVERAMRMLDGFLTAYPDDPAADQASSQEPVEFVAAGIPALAEHGLGQRAAVGVDRQRSQPACCVWLGLRRSATSVGRCSAG
jgi:hypothetical protein